MDNGEVIPDPDSAVEISDNRGIIEFRNVTFSYEKGHPFLSNISFQINPGEMVAVVGATGEGTLIHHQNVICCVACGRLSLRRKFVRLSRHSLGALHMTPCWCPGITQNPLI